MQQFGSLKDHPVTLTIEDGAEVAASDRFGLLPVVVDAAVVAKTPLVVENENVRRRERSVSGRHALRVAVEEIGKLVASTLGVQLHVFERIADVGIAELIQPYRQRIVG